MVQYFKEISIHTMELKDNVKEGGEEWKAVNEIN